MYFTAAHRDHLPAQPIHSMSKAIQSSSETRRLSRRCFGEALALLPLAMVAGCESIPASPVTVTSPDPATPVVPVPVAPPATPPQIVEPRGPSGMLADVTANTEGTVATIVIAGTPLQEPGGVARAFADVGGIRRFMVLARVGTDRIAALDARCTHEGCTVDRFSTPVFECPCHGSQFEWTGQVRRGPAPAALPSLAVDFDGRVAVIRF